MAKMTLEEIQAATKDLSEEEQELLYLALAMKMEEVNPAILKMHHSLLEKRWTDFTSGNVKAVSLDRALQEIDDIQDA
jgi:hypothetical protein